VEVRNHSANSTGRFVHNIKMNFKRLGQVQWTGGRCRGWDARFVY